MEGRLPRKGRVPVRPGARTHDRDRTPGVRSLSWRQALDCSPVRMTEGGRETYERSGSGRPTAPPSCTGAFLGWWGLRNHLRAETSHHRPAKPSTTATATGA